MREKFDKIVNSGFGRLADRFYNSVWYIAAIGFVCALCHCCNIVFVGAALLAVLVVPCLVFCKNSFTLMPFLFMCSFVLSPEIEKNGARFASPAMIAGLCIVFAFVAAAFAFNIVYYGKWRRIFKRAYLSVSFALITVAFLFGGVGSRAWTFAGFGMSIAIAAVMFVAYSLLVNCGEYNGRKTAEYFAISVIVAAIVIIIDYFQKFVINDFNIGVSAVKDFLKLGFVGPNTGSAIITLAIPMTFYLVYNYKHGWAFLPLVALELFAIIMAYSRASLVVALPGTVIVAIVMCFKKKNGRLGYWIAFGVSVCLAIVVIVLLRHWIYDKFVALFVGNITGSGRTGLWKAGFSAWKSYPIFGAGLWYLKTTGHWYYSFHCTPLTYLFCFGVVGLAAYVYHRYKTVRLVFSAKLTPERVFIALCALAMLLNALLDIAMTSATHLTYYAAMLALLERDVLASNAELVKPLPDLRRLFRRGKAESSAPDERTAEEDADISVAPEANEVTDKNDIKVSEENNERM